MTRTAYVRRHTLDCRLWLLATRCFGHRVPVCRPVSPASVLGLVTKGVG